MLKSDLIAALVLKQGLSAIKAEALVETVMQGMVDVLCAGEDIELRGFGAFRVKHYPSYQGRNPKTGLPITVKAKRGVVFRTGKELRERVNSGAAPKAVPAVQAVTTAAVDSMADGGAREEGPAPGRSSPVK